MADGGLLLIFRAYTTDFLLARRAKLIDQYTSYTSQTVGSKSFTKDLRNIQAQLEAIQFVLNERTTPYQGTVLTDFSQGAGIQQGQPAGTFDQLSY